jgi:putative Mg2+ transporter-C (MgtC) family protein
MLFSFISRTFNPGNPTVIAAQIVSGVGFLGAGMIIKSDKTQRISNLTTAASVWYSAGIGMALGFGLHLIAIFATLYVTLISLIPKIHREHVTKQPNA